MLLFASRVNFCGTSSKGDGDLEDADPDPEPLEDLDGAFADARDCWKIDAETLKGFYLHSPTGQLFSWDQAQGVLYEYIRESGECKAGSRVVFLEQAVIAEHDICCSRLAGW